MTLVGFYYRFRWILRIRSVRFRFNLCMACTNNRLQAWLERGGRNLLAHKNINTQPPKMVAFVVEAFLTPNGSIITWRARFLTSIFLISCANDRLTFGGPKQGMQIRIRITGVVKRANYLHENIFMSRFEDWRPKQLPAKSRNLPLGVCGEHLVLGESLPRGTFLQWWQYFLFLFRRNKILLCKEMKVLCPYTGFNNECYLDLT